MVRNEFKIGGTSLLASVTMRALVPAKCRRQPPHPVVAVVAVVVVVIV